MAKRTRMVARLLLTCACLTGSLAGAVEAKDILMSMAKTLAQAKTMSVTMRMCYDSVQENGVKVSFREERDVILRRPNEIHVDAIQGDGDEHALIFDGKDLYLYSYEHNVYSVTPCVGDLDKAIDYASNTMGIRVPLAPMLLSDFPKRIESLKPDVDFVEEDLLDDVPTDHLIVTLPDVDLQVWIADDNLPRHVIITYKKAPGQPQFRADFIDWNLQPDIAPSDFVFSPPEGAEKIPHLLPEQITLHKEKVAKGKPVKESEKKKIKTATPTNQKPEKNKGGDK